MKFRRIGVMGAAAATLLAAGCGNDNGGEPEEPDLGGARSPFPSLFCPGSDGCTGEGDGVFRVGAARRSISPDLAAHETEWEDTNGNSEYDIGEPFTDTNNNGTFDAVWLAGFGTGRPATGIHADTWVRAIVFEWNDVRIGLAVVDSVGWMADEIDATRDILPAELNIDHLIVSSIHVHEAPDTMGLWGRQELETGLDQDFQKMIRQQTVAAVSAAVSDLMPATMSYATTETLDETGSARPYVGDGRDPNILDPTVTLMQFQSVASPGEVVATLVHWAAHPEYSGSRNNMVTPDYVYMIREAIENGLAEEPARGLPAVDGVGGEVVFLQGPLGGQIGPKRTRPIGIDGQEITEEGLEKADAVGRNVGRLALEALTSATDVIDVSTPDIEMRTGVIDLEVQNTFYHVAGIVGVFARAFHGYDESRPISETNVPYLESRVTYLRVGPVAIITAPGELHPELFIGGYDGSYSYDEPLVALDSENPPPLDKAPAGPYLRDIMLADDKVDHAICLGLGEDMIGYIVPSYNYILSGNAPYIDEAIGDHYEETNSVSPRVEEQAVGPMRELIEWTAATAFSSGDDS